MKKRRSIQTKLMLLTVGMLLFGILLTGIPAVAGLIQLHRIASDSMEQLGSTAASGAQRALEQQAVGQLERTAVEKAEYVGQQFLEIERSLHELAGYMEDVYAHPQKYPDRIVALPDRESHTLTAQRLQSAQIKGDGTAEQRRELCRISNVADLLVLCNQYNDMISSDYVATVSGWVIQADDYSYSKYEADSDIPQPFEAAQRQWFQRALLAEQGEIVFSDVMEDIHGGGECIVCAQPVYCDGKIVAVVGIGSYLETVKSVVLDTRIGDYGDGYAFLVNQYGQIMISPKESGETKADTSAGADLRRLENEKLAEAVTNMVGRGQGSMKLTIDGEQKYLAYAPLPGLNWSFVTVLGEREVLAAANAGQTEILAQKHMAYRQMDAQIAGLYRTLLLAVGITVLAASIPGLGMSHHLVVPLKRLRMETEAIGAGNLELEICIRTGDEIEELARAFNAMKKNLREHILSIRQITAEKERIGAELSVAAHIQASMLPCIFPAFPGRPEFDIYASMTPAKEVGGDFYDFFLVDEDHLAIVIADVSGKGVPAALFMVITKTLIKNHMQKGINPAAVFTAVNQQLSETNEEEMFVTAWMGVLEISTGHMTAVNAGHNPPLLCRTNEAYGYLRMKAGFVLAGLATVRYTSTEFELGVGDTLYLYTDGVTEAASQNEELYGEERLQTILNQHKQCAPEELLAAVHADIARFCNGAPQFDDITMLALRMNR